MPEHKKYRVVVSPRAARQLSQHAAFVARLDEAVARKLTREFSECAAALAEMPFRWPLLRSSVFSHEKYRKVIFDTWYLLLYQVREDVVYIEYVIDGRQDYEWLLK